MEIEKLKDMLRNATGSPAGIQMCQEAADALELLQDENDRLKSQVPMWIPVEERLPEKRKTVLALRDVSGYKNSRRPSPVMVACLDDWGASQCWMEYDCETRECEEIECGVTHWMPLPQAPKEEKKDD